MKLAVLDHSLKQIIEKYELDIEEIPSIILIHGASNVICKGVNAKQITLCAHFLPWNIYISYYIHPV